VVLPMLAQPFVAVFGYKPPLPRGVRVVTLMPSARLGSWQDAIRWREANSRRWLEEGAAAAAKNISCLDCFAR